MARSDKITQGKRDKRFIVFFFDEETDTLFAVEKIDECIAWKDLSNEPAIKKWWDHLADIMEVNPDNSPVITKLEMVFHLD